MSRLTRKSFSGQVTGAQIIEISLGPRAFVPAIAMGANYPGGDVNVICDTSATRGTDLADPEDGAVSYRRGAGAPDPLTIAMQWDALQ